MGKAPPQVSLLTQYEKCIMKVMFTTIGFLKKFSQTSLSIIKWRKSILRLALGQPVFMSLNMSERCPNNCHCYWRAQKKVVEMSDEEVILFIKNRKKEGFVHGTWVGGEPYVRADLLEKVTSILPVNWVVTSGTIPLRPLNAAHFISIDGADAKTHDTLRGRPGLYDWVMSNLQEARKKGISRLYIHTVLNAVNCGQLEEIYRFWSQSDLVSGMFFSTHTPIEGADDARLRLSREQHKKIVENLLKILKEDQGKFLKMTKGMINRFDPDFTKKLTPQNCGAAKYVASFNGSGERISQCILSEKANCSECGCVVMAMVSAVNKLFPPELDTFRLLTRGLR